MKRKVLIGSGAIALLLGSAVVAPSFIDWNKYKGQILTQLHGATGYDYDIGGPLALAILPLPHVELSALTVKTPKEQGGGTLLTLDRADVSVELLPLLGGRVNIRKITLEKPVFNVGIDKDGNPSWMTAQLKPKKDAPASAPSGGSPPSSMADKVVLQAVEIHNGSFRFDDARGKASYAAQNINVTIKADTLFGPYAVDGGLDYNNSKIDVFLKTGVIGKGADSVAVQLKAGVPDARGTLEFAGVAGLKAPYQIQGETTLKADNFAALLKPFTATPPNGLDKPLTVKGLMTYAGDSFAFRNAQLGYAGNVLNGDIAVSGMKQPQAEVQVTLAADKPVNIDALMQPGKPAPLLAQKNTGAAQAVSGGFLPKTLSLPFALNGKVSVALKEASYKGQSFTDAGVTLALTPKAFSGDFKSALPGNGTAAGSFKLAYATMTKTGTGTGAGVTLSDPSMIYRVQVKSSDPRALLGAFASPAQLKSIEPALSAPLALDVTGNVTPASVTADAGSLSVAGATFALGGSYTPKAAQGRDAVRLTVSADRLDADRLMGRSPVDHAPETDAKAPPASAPKTDIAAAARSFKLPVDLDLGATVKTLHYNGNDYQNVSVKGAVTGNTVKIADAGFQDDAGNVLHLSGNIADINALGGIDLTVNGKTPDANLLLKTLKVDASAVPANAGAASLVADIKGQADKLAFTANLNVLRGALEASGSLTDLLGRPSLGDLTFRLRHPDYEALARLFSPSFRASVNVSKNLDVFASVQNDGKVYSFKQIKATVGPAAMEGEAKADMGGAVPDLTATLQFTTLPLDKLLGAEATKGGGATTTIRPASSSKSSGGGHWSRDPVNTAWMHKWNADIKTSAGDVSYGNWKFTNAALNVTLKDGTLTLSKLDGGLYGGHINMTAKMAPAAQGVLDASSTMKLDGVSLDSFVSSFSGSRLIKAQGTINLASGLTAKGESPAALISSLAGKGTVTGKDIDFQGFDLAQLSGVLAQPSSSVGKNFGKILGSATSGGSTHFDTLDGAYAVAAGVITFDKMLLKGPDADVNTSGNVNLPVWTLDMTSAITLAEPKDNPPPPLKISFKGPLDNPAQTFGQSAMESYFMQQYGSKIQDRINKLDKNGVLQKSGLGAVLGGVLGQPAAAPADAAPAAGGSETVTPQPLNPQNANPQKAAEPSEPTASDAAPAQDAQPVKPEDAFKSLLGNVLNKQR